MLVGARTTADYLVTVGVFCGFIHTVAFTVWLSRLPDEEYVWRIEQAPNPFTKVWRAPLGCVLALAGLFASVFLATLWEPTSLIGKVAMVLSFFVSVFFTVATCTAAFRGRPAWLLHRVFREKPSTNARSS